MQNWNSLTPINLRSKRRFEEFATQKNAEGNVVSAARYPNGLLMSWISWVNDPKAWVGLVTLTFLQIVLGVDNIVLLTVLSGQLEEDEQAKARQLGLLVAMISRLILLCTLLWIASF